MADMSITIELPLRIESVANRREHWRAREKDEAAPDRRAGGAAASAALRGHDHPHRAASAG